ncbi:PH domain-containing protein [Saccharothrix sp. Mg75]|uniref:PH domain-containing protein n=1 Tax=Saccharothrix sp. Mg75 TaxID=3445357 RepID=UPI003EEDF988
MAYPDDLLSPSEHVVTHKHPHWKALLVPVVVLLVVLVGGTWLAVLAADLTWASTAWLVLAAVSVALLAWLVLAPVLRWRTTHLVVTTERVMWRMGVVRRVSLDLPLRRIDSVRFEQGVTDRLLGCGTLVIDSASDTPLELDDIPDVEAVNSLLQREINDNPDDDHQPEDRVSDGRA